jgi:hypothetical protein
MINIQPGPEGFVLGEAAKWVGVGRWEPEWCPAWIRETETGADVIWIQFDGDYSGLFRRVGKDAYIIKEAA